MNATQSNRSHNVQNDDDRQKSAGPFAPWYRSREPWLLLAVVVAMTVVAWPSLTTSPGSFDFWVWSLIVVLVVAFAVVQFRAWWFRGRKRPSDRV
ncbi:hypothetical protein [Arthrobacter sp. 4R501]|uniref:hypothetical protein n=1 Tax=Arthrobacter sp. 4R501 TaxID=2058886 RepID=UPI0011B0AC19|nr:hypothetical protein [Arthrobacter sp. 4R501]